MSCAANAAPLINLGKAVVVVAADPGSETAEVLVRQDFSTPGMRAYRPAKDGHSRGGSRKVLLNKKALALIMVMTR